MPALRRRRPKPSAWAIDVRRRRLALDLSQRELADLSETSRVSMARIELGMQVPQPGMKARIEGALAVLEG